MSILSHVSFQSCDSPPSDVWNILAVSITKSMFFKDSGIASNFKLKMLVNPIHGIDFIHMQKVTGIRFL